MDLNAKIGIGAIILVLISLILSFDVIQTVLLILFLIFWLLTLIMGKTQGKAVMIIFISLGQVAYSILSAFSVVPGSDIIVVLYISIILQIIAGILMVMVGTFAMEMDVDNSRE